MLYAKLVEMRDGMAQNLIWLDWAVRLQALAQAGLYYGKDPFDRER